MPIKLTCCIWNQKQGGGVSGLGGLGGVEEEEEEEGEKEEEKKYTSNMAVRLMAK